MDRDSLKSLFTGYWKYLALNAAVKLNLFDHLKEPYTCTGLADKLDLDRGKLELLLQALENEGFIHFKDGIYINTPTSELLTEDHPEGLKYACLNWAGEHMNAWLDLDYSIKSGKSSFEKRYKEPFFQYLHYRPEKLHNYHKAMFEYASDDYRNLPDLLDFSRFSSLMDVGGGYGAAISQIKQANQGLDCFLFDLPEVLYNVKLPDINIVHGDFFTAIPSLAEAVLLTRILHDWNDERATQILKNVYAALPKGGEIIIIENCSDKIAVDLSLLSLNMLAICESHERTSMEYISLCKSAGFHFKKSTQLNQLQTVLTLKK